MGKPRNRCDHFEGRKRCQNKAHMEVHYSRSGKKPKKAWVDFVTAKFVEGRGLVRDRSKRPVRRFTWDYPRDMVWSFLCRKHFDAAKAAGRVFMWGSA